MNFPSQIGNFLIRLPHDRSLSEDLGFWRIAHVKPRNEKALAQDCSRLEIGFFLPLYEKRIRRRDNNKPRKSLLPLFPGYVPFVDRENGKFQLYETNRVVNVLDVLDQERFVEDLTQVWQAITSGAPLGVGKTFTVGQKVMVKEGPLQGLVGVIMQTTNRQRLFLNVEEFHMAVSVELDREDVELI
ncbi:MAG: hypothetical protein C4527_19375 [Candidatus Omnitrophota bacterium]|jgi:transcription antitermination factor NusG|nr:MAG: hypothetical protein C4527_19375 [Candidatus Omnitrophota bacterium]